MKSFLKIALVLMVWLGLPTCIPCPDHWRIDEIQISFFSPGVGSFKAGGLEADSIMLDVNLISEIYGSTYDFSGNAAYAFSCDDPLLEHSYTAFEVTSSTDYNDVPAGQSLNDKFTLDGVFPIDSVLTLHLKKGAYNYALFFLHLTEKPAIPKHKFTIKITDWEGNIITGESDELDWH